MAGDLWLSANAETLADYARRGDWDQFAAKLEENHRILEDHLHTREITFTLAGPMTVSTSPKWYAPRNLRLHEVVVSLVTAGTTTTTVNLKRNGSTVATLTLASSDTFEQTYTISSTDLSKDVDYLQADVSGAGTGAEDLDVQVRYR